MFYKNNHKLFKHKTNSKNAFPPSLFTVIIGSFRKHLSEIRNIKSQFEKINIAVLSPCDSDAVNLNEEFILFHSDPVSNSKILQDSVFVKIRNSTFVVLANVGGYIGDATMLEIGYAIAMGIDIYAIEPVENPHIAPYCKLLSNAFPDIQLKKLKNIQKSRRSKQLVSSLKNS